jgi:hypothetical protein
MTQPFLHRMRSSIAAPIPRASLIAPNPVIVVEVISPTSTRRDLAVKFTNYFRHPGVQHYLIVVMENRTVIQHSRSEGDTLKTRIAGPGDRLTFDPPGIAVAVSDLFKISTAPSRITGSGDRFRGADRGRDGVAAPTSEPCLRFSQAVDLIC